MFVEKLYVSKSKERMRVDIEWIESDRVALYEKTQKRSKQWCNETLEYHWDYYNRILTIEQLPRHYIVRQA